jgi:hypothetical protein
VALKKLMSPELTQDGGKSSLMKDNTSSISETIRHSMSIKIRMLKDKRSLSGRDIMAGIKDGELSILTNLPRKDQVDSIKNMDCTSTDHSSSDLDFQCRELLNLFHGMLDSEDTIKEEEINRLGDSTEYRIPSKT